MIGSYRGDGNVIRLREIRERRGLTQMELSQLAGVSQSIISNIENGCVSPTVRVLQKLARALDVSVIEFFSEDQSENVQVKINRSDVE